MTLTDVQKKKIEDVAIGNAISQNMNVHDQIAALRKQVIAISTAGKVPLVAEMVALEAVVSKEKKKKDGK